MSSIKRLIFSRGVLEDDPIDPPLPVGNAVNFSTSNFTGAIPSCEDAFYLYGNSTRLQRNIIDWLNSRTYSINVSHMNYTVFEGFVGTPPNGYYRFEGGRNIIRLSNGVVQDVQYCP